MYSPFEAFTEQSSGPLVLLVPKRAPSTLVPQKQINSTRLDKEWSSDAQRLADWAIQGALVSPVDPLPNLLCTVSPSPLIATLPTANSFITSLFPVRCPCKIAAVCRNPREFTAAAADLPGCCPQRPCSPAGWRVHRLHMDPWYIGQGLKRECRVRCTEQVTSD